MAPCMGPMSPVRAYSLWAGLCPEKLVKTKKKTLQVSCLVSDCIKLARYFLRGGGKLVSLIIFLLSISAIFFPNLSKDGYIRSINWFDKFVRILG